MERAFVTALRDSPFGDEWGKCKDKCLQGSCLGVQDKGPGLHTHQTDQQLLVASPQQEAGSVCSLLYLRRLSQSLTHSKHSITLPEFMEREQLLS